MDDFIYGEPLVTTAPSVPEPGTVAMLEQGRHGWVTGFGSGAEQRGRAKPGAHF